ncbi:MAG: homocysteine S-methyltransferase family protein [Sedimentisphaerales bacterium]|nr:homocysteine S-methyltransferase family protein [Sedimentisphaerales bacterium]
MKFLDLLDNKRIVLLDGAMGTQLDKKGLMSRGQNNLDVPEAVLEIHRAYVQAGSDALITNTLTMNRLYIETHNVGVPVGDVNRAGVTLARQAAGDERCVLGNMSSTGQLLEPYGSYSEAQFCGAFREQAEALAEAGVDGFMIESMFDLREALCALRACKEVSSLPVLISIAFQTSGKGGRTMMGDTAEQSARQLTDAGADAIGANCGDLDPNQTAEVVALLAAATNLPIAAQPNAGKPRLVEDRTVFDMAPEPFAEGIAACIKAGARLVGGCCGTGPEHIEAVRGVIERM